MPGEKTNTHCTHTHTAHTQEHTHSSIVENLGISAIFHMSLSTVRKNNFQCLLISLHPPPLAPLKRRVVLSVPVPPSHTQSPPLARQSAVPQLRRESNVESSWKVHGRHYKNPPRVKLMHPTHPTPYSLPPLPTLCNVKQGINPSAMRICHPHRPGRVAPKWPVDGCVGNMVNWKLF